jgi:hypothetical protein
LADEQDFNRGGNLDRSRLAEIRKEMRELAKQDALILISDIGRSASDSIAGTEAGVS